MELFIGNLPPETSAVELRKLLGQADKKARYQICQKTLRDGTVKCFGKALIDSDKLARELIHLLNDSMFNDARLEVRPFIERSHIRDQRGPLWSGKPWTGLDRRKTDRRGK